jgi:hypothetical protein
MFVSILYLSGQRPGFNKMSLPPGMKFAPSGELCPLEEIFTLSFTPTGEPPRVNTL